MDVSVILNYVLGGGLLATLVGLLTLKASVKRALAEADKARAEAEKARAEADTVHITNTEQATRILIQNIVEPLRKELHETRRDLNSTKREMARLRKAIDDANRCDYRDDCPVLHRLRREKGDGGDLDFVGDQPSGDGEPSPDDGADAHAGDGTVVVGDSDDSD